MPKGTLLVAHSEICCSHSSEYEDWGRDAVCFGRKTSISQASSVQEPATALYQNPYEYSPPLLNAFLRDQFYVPCILLPSGFLAKIFNALLISLTSVTYLTRHFFPYSISPQYYSKVKSKAIPVTGRGGP
jgi:hypothetical protein